MRHNILIQVQCAACHRPLELESGVQPGGALAHGGTEPTPPTGAAIVPAVLRVQRCPHCYGSLARHARAITEGLNALARAPLPDSGDAE